MESWNLDVKKLEVQRIGSVWFGSPDNFLFQKWFVMKCGTQFVFYLFEVNQLKDLKDFQAIRNILSCDAYVSTNFPINRRGIQICLNSDKSIIHSDLRQYSESHAIRNESTSLLAKHRVTLREIKGNISWKLNRFHRFWLRRKMSDNKVMKFGE